MKGTLSIGSSGRVWVQADLIVFDNASGADGVLSVSNELQVDGELKVENGAACTVSGSGNEIAADHINIRDTGTMTVSGGGKLTLTDASNTRSRINGRLDLQATLYISDHHTLRGDDDGEILMSGSALIDGASGKTLTIDGVGTARADSLTVHGTGEIKVGLMNKAYVVADVDNAGYYLFLTNNVKDSTTDGHWMAEGGANATLWASTAEVKGGGTWELIDDSDTYDIMGRIWVDTCCVRVTGDVVNTNGELCLGNDFCTTGDFTLKSLGSPWSRPYVHMAIIDTDIDPDAKFAVNSTSLCSTCTP